MHSIEIPLTDSIKSCLSCSYIQRNWNTCVVSLTKNKQCIVKASNFIIFCCDVPFEDVKEMTFEKFYDDFLILIQSHKDGCCAVSLQKKMMIDYWEEGVDIYIEDYVSIGHDQIIVVFDSESGNDFVVIDYRCCKFDTRDEANNINDAKKDLPLEYGKGYESAIQAVEKNLLASTMSLHNYQIKNKEKLDLIELCCSNLTKQSMDAQINCSSHNFVNLLSRSLLVSNDEHKIESRCDVFAILKTWTAIYFDDFTVTVHLHNCSTKDLCNVSLGILTDDNCSCFSTIHFMNNNTADVACGSSRKHRKIDSSMCKQYFMKNDKCFLVTSMKLPKLKKDTIFYSLRIDYQLPHDAYHYSCITGRIKLTSSDIINGSLDVQQASLSQDDRSNLVYKNNFMKHSFKLTSKITPLMNLSVIMSKRLVCDVKVLGNVSILQLKYISGEIRLQPSYSSCLCTVLTKNQNEFRIVLKEIENIIPADVEFCEIFDDYLLEEVIYAMKDETNKYHAVEKDNLKKIIDVKMKDEVIVIDVPTNLQKREIDICKVPLSTMTCFMLKTDEIVLSYLASSSN